MGANDCVFLVFRVMDDDEAVERIGTVARGSKHWDDGLTGVTRKVGSGGCCPKLDVGRNGGCGGGVSPVTRRFIRIVFRCSDCDNTGRGGGVC